MTTETSEYGLDVSLFYVQCFTQFRLSFNIKAHFFQKMFYVTFKNSFEQILKLNLIEDKFFDEKSPETTGFLHMLE